MTFRPAHIALLVASTGATPALAEYGAVAVNANTSNFGFSRGFKSKASAREQAMAFCHEYSKGKAGCEVVLTTSKCAAVARAGRSLAIGESRRTAAANTEAMTACSASHGNSCKIVADFCASQ